MISHFTFSPHGAERVWRFWSWRFCIRSLIYEVRRWRGTHVVKLLKPRTEQHGTGPLPVSAE
jgi:hypothetical protein